MASFGDEDEIHPSDRICVVFADRVHRAKINTIVRRSRMDPTQHDVIAFRTLGASEEAGTVPMPDRGLKWEIGWEDETMAALLAANALAELLEPTVQLNSHTGRPTWVL